MNVFKQTRPELKDWCLAELLSTLSFASTLQIVAVFLCWGPVWPRSNLRKVESGGWTEIKWTFAFHFNVRHFSACKGLHCCLPQSAHAEKSPQIITDLSPKQAGGTNRHLSRSSGASRPQLQRTATQCLLLCPCCAMLKLCDVYEVLALCERGGLHLGNET